MAEEYVAKAQKAREQLIARRRQVIDALAAGQFDELVAKIQVALAAIDQAEADEKRIRPGYM